MTEQSNTLLLIFAPYNRNKCIHCTLYTSAYLYCTVLSWYWGLTFIGVWQVCSHKHQNICIVSHNMSGPGQKPMWKFQSRCSVAADFFITSHVVNGEEFVFLETKFEIQNKTRQHSTVRNSDGKIWAVIYVIYI